MKGGSAFEAEWSKAHSPDATPIDGFGVPALRTTLEAMIRGDAAIHHAQLWDLDSDAYGQADLLMREDGARSDLGSWHYRPLEIKRSSKLRDDHALQCAFYNRVLSKLQGYAAPEATVVLGDVEERIKPKDYEGELDEVIAKWCRLRDDSREPEIGYLKDVSAEWRPYARKLLTARRDVTLIAGFTSRVRSKLRDRFGIDTIDKLSKLKRKDFQAAFSDDRGRKLWLQMTAYLEKRPVLAGDSPVEIPRRKRMIYWDVEDSDSSHETEPPHVYLIGTVEHGRYRAFTCRGAADEERMAEEFLSYIGVPKDVILYQWTSYEDSSLRAMGRRHPRLAARLQKVADRTFDLYAAIKNKVFLPVGSYSVKDVGPACGFNWPDGVEDGRIAMCAYWDYLAGRAENAMDSILDYNQADCRAMAAIVLCLADAGFMRMEARNER